MAPSSSLDMDMDPVPTTLAPATELKDTPPTPASTNPVSPTEPQPTPNPNDTVAASIEASLPRSNEIQQDHVQDAHPTWVGNVNSQLNGEQHQDQNQDTPLPAGAQRRARTDQGGIDLRRQRTPSRTNNDKFKAPAMANDDHWNHHHTHRDEDEDDFSLPATDEKYKRLKRKLKEALEENERLSIAMEKYHRRVRNLRREKNLLLDRLCTYQHHGSDSSASLSSLSSDSDSSDASQEDSHMPVKPSHAPTGSKPRGAGAKTAAAAAHHPKKTAAKTQRRRSPAAGTSGAKDSKPPASPTTVAPTPSSITNVGSATQKPKRVHHSNKQRPGLAKARKVQILEKDDSGQIKLPVTIGIITLMNTGRVVHDREAFHNERYIWPVGYKMSRSYNSMVDPHQHTTYTCSVIDDGEAPKFQIDAEDQPGKPIIAGTATGAWTHVVKAANLIRKRDHSNSASGPDYFGFSNATIAKLIQELPNADLCTSYIMQRFEEPSLTTARAAPTVSGAPGEKRKISSLKGVKGGNADAAAEEDEEEEDGDDYASLGTPGRKKVKASSSPVIRHAGLEPTKAIGSQAMDELDSGEAVEVEEMDELEGDDNDQEEEHEEEDDGGDETHSEADVPERRMSAAGTVEVAARSPPEPLHSIATLQDGGRVPIVVTTSSTTPNVSPAPVQGSKVSAVANSAAVKGPEQTPHEETDEMIDIEDHGSDVEIVAGEEEDELAMDKEDEDEGMTTDEDITMQQAQQLQQQQPAQE